MEEVSHAEKYNRTGLQFSVGCRLDVCDSGTWYPCRIVQLNWPRQLIRIHYEGWAPRFDEWLPMASPDLRAGRQSVEEVPQVKYDEGDHVLARWTDRQNYAAVVTRVMANDNYQVRFYDGIVRRVRGVHLQPSSQLEMTRQQQQYAVSAATSAGADGDSDCCVPVCETSEDGGLMAGDARAGGETASFCSSAAAVVSSNSVSTSTEAVLHCKRKRKVNPIVEQMMQDIKRRRQIAQRSVSSSCSSVEPWRVAVDSRGVAESVPESGSSKTGMSRRSALVVATTSSTPATCSTPAVNTSLAQCQRRQSWTVGADEFCSDYEDDEEEEDEGDSVSVVDEDVEGDSVSIVDEDVDSEFSAVIGDDSSLDAFTDQCAIINATTTTDADVTVESQARVDTVSSDVTTSQSTSSSVTSVTTSHSAPVVTARRQQDFIFTPEQARSAKLPLGWALVPVVERVDKSRVEATSFMCPHTGCGKQFRKELLLQMHLKHYHRSSVCENVRETDINDCPSSSSTTMMNSMTGGVRRCLSVGDQAVRHRSRQLTGEHSSAHSYHSYTSPSASDARAACDSQQRGRRVAADESDSVAELIQQLDSMEQQQQQQLRHLSGTPASENDNSEDNNNEEQRGAADIKQETGAARIKHCASVDQIKREFETYNDCVETKIATEDSAVSENMMTSLSPSSRLIITDDDAEHHGGVSARDSSNTAADVKTPASSSAHEHTTITSLDSRRVTDSTTSLTRTAPQKQRATTGGGRRRGRGRGRGVRRHVSHGGSARAGGVLDTTWRQRRRSNTLGSMDEVAVFSPAAQSDLTTTASIRSLDDESCESGTGTGTGDTEQLDHNDVVHCHCGLAHRNAGLMIQCDVCKSWQHGECVSVASSDQAPDYYVCYVCRQPRRQRRSHRLAWFRRLSTDGAVFSDVDQVGGGVSNNTARMCGVLRSSTQLVNHTLDVQRCLSSVQQQLAIARDLKHPKLYMWAQMSHTHAEQSDDSSLLHADQSDNSSLLHADLTDLTSSSAPTDVVPTSAEVDDVVTSVPAPPDTTRVCEGTSESVGDVLQQTSVCDSSDVTVSATTDCVDSNVTVQHPDEPVNNASVSEQTTDQQQVTVEETAAVSVDDCAHTDTLYQAVEHVTLSSVSSRGCVQSRDNAEQHGADDTGPVADSLDEVPVCDAVETVSLHSATIDTASSSVLTSSLQQDQQMSGRTEQLESTNMQDTPRDSRVSESCVVRAADVPVHVDPPAASASAEVAEQQDKPQEEDEEERVGEYATNSVDEEQQLMQDLASLLPGVSDLNQLIETDVATTSPQHKQQQQQQRHRRRTVSVDARIDPVECRANLCRHIGFVQDRVARQLHDIETQIADLEKVVDYDEFDEMIDLSGNSNNTIGNLINRLKLMQNYL